MRKLLLLRPQPGLSISMERARALGIAAIPCPLFQVEAVAWEAPDPARFDALLLTSANAVRHAGSGLDPLKSLPVHAIGRATAEAARAAGLRIETCGSGNVADLLAGLPSSLHLLHLAGQDYRPTGQARIDRRIVYRAVPIADPGLPRLHGMVVAVHSPRAGARLAELAGDVSRAAVAAISAAAAANCGSGWERVAVAPEPSDKSLLALAARLCHTLAQ